MKTILVLTDFSNNALNAAEAAVILAGKIHANLLIMNSDNSIPLIPYHKDVPLITEIVSWDKVQREQMEKLIAHLQYFADLNMEQERKIKIYGQLMKGQLWGNVKEILKEKNIELIVTGSQSGSKVDHILFGSDISALIEHVDHPVVVVPQNCSFRKLNRVVFATCFNDSDIYAINYLFKLGKLLKYQLDIVHISLYGVKPGLKNESVRAYINKLSEKEYPSVLFRDVKGKHLLPRLIKYSRQREADLLALGHQHHSYFGRMLKEDTVMLSIKQQKNPILVFPLVELQKTKIGKTTLGYIL